MPPKKRLKTSPSQQARIIAAECGFPEMFNDILKKFVGEERRDEFTAYINTVNYRNKYPSIFNSQTIKDNIMIAKEAKRKNLEDKRKERTELMKTTLKEELKESLLDRFYSLSDLDLVKDPYGMEEADKLLKENLQWEKINTSNLILIKINIGKLFR